MVFEGRSESELNEQHVSDVIQDHIEMDESVYRYIFEVVVFTNMEDEIPESIEYYLESEDCNKYFECLDKHVVVCYKQVLKSQPCYAWAIYNTFFKTTR